MDATKANFQDWLEYDHRRRELIYLLQEAFEKVMVDQETLPLPKWITDGFLPQFPPIQLLGEFSYLRLEGLKLLHKTVCNLSDEEVAIFASLQDDSKFSGNINSPPPIHPISGPCLTLFSFYYTIVLFRIIYLILVRRKKIPEGLQSFPQLLFWELSH